MGRKKKILAGICVLCLLVLNVLIVCHRGSVGGNYTCRPHCADPRARRHEATRCRSRLHTTPRR